MVGVSIVIARHPEWNEGIVQILRQAQNDRKLRIENDRKLRIENDRKRRARNDS